jgi:DNA-binding NtrC family response regulator
MNSPLVLVIDDESAVRFGIRDYLESSGLKVEEAGSCRKAREIFATARPDVVVADYSLPDGNALELLPMLRGLDAEVPMIVLTGFGSIELAVDAIKAGAEHFLTKPVELETLLLLIRRSLEARRERKRHRAQDEASARGRLDPFLGKSAAMRRLQQDVARVVGTDSPLLLLGETGSGKGVLARWLHENGPRAKDAFVDVNCAGLGREFLESELFGHERGAFTGAVAAKPGLLETAHHGTLFLDEVGDLEPQVQPKLLKVIEEKRFRRLGDVRDRSVDVRLLAATHQDLGRLVDQGLFRRDLFFRVAAVPLRIPPLRERSEDVVPIARWQLEAWGPRFPGKRLTLEPAAEPPLERHSWPGNVRELRNVLERAALLSPHGSIGPPELRFDSSDAAAAAGSAAPSPDWTLEQVERWHVERVLEREGGHVERAAKRLGMPRSTLYQRIKEMGLRTTPQA